MNSERVVRRLRLSVEFPSSFFFFFWLTFSFGSLLSNKWRIEPFELFLKIFIGPISSFQWRLLDVHWLVPLCSRGTQYQVAYTSFSKITSVKAGLCFGLELLAVSLGPRLLSECSKNAQVIARFTAEPHTWIKSGEILILILDFPEHHSCRIRCQAQMLDLDKMAPRCEHGWMLSIHTDEKNKKKRKGGEEFLEKSQLLFWASKSN